MMTVDYKSRFMYRGVLVHMRENGTCYSNDASEIKIEHNGCGDAERYINLHWIDYFPYDE